MPRRTYPEQPERVITGDGAVLEGLGAARKSACLTPGPNDWYALRICVDRLPATRVFPDIHSSRAVAQVFVDFVGGADLHLQEVFVAMYLSNKNKPLGIRAVHVGSRDQTMVSFQDVLRPAMILPASAVIVGHNHPSGSNLPSQADIALTKELAKACTTMQVTLLDHVIFTAATGAYYSFTDSGLLVPESPAR